MAHNLIYFTFSLIISILLTACDANKSIVMNHINYKILVAQSFSVSITDLSNNDSETVFSYPSDSDSIITSSAFDYHNGKIAIAIKKFPPTEKSAKILFIEDKAPYSVVKEIQTGIDQILDMSFSNKGDAVFVAGNAILDEPHEIGLIRNQSNKVEYLASGKKFFDPSWDSESQRVYFSSLHGSRRMVEYVEVNSPGISRELSKGRSISASDNDKQVCYLSLDARAFFLRNDEKDEKLNIDEKYLDPKFADVIRFVRLGDELVVKSYVKATSYKLLIIPPPYDKVYPFVDTLGMQTFEVIKKRNDTN